jgi:hypothetical protein
MLVGERFVCNDGSLVAGDAGVDGPSGAPGKWTLLQTRAGVTGSVSMMPSGAGHLIVVGVETDDIGGSMPVQSVTDNAGNVYSLAPGSRSKESTEALSAEIWYTSNSKAGATQVTATGPIVVAVAIWEVDDIDMTAPVTATKLDEQPSSSTPLGARITTASNGEFVVSIAIVSNDVVGIASGNAFTNDHNVFGNGWAHLTDPASPAGVYQAQWSQPATGVSCASSAAFRVKR